MAAHSCSRCTNTWGGLAQCHCATCHNTFSGITAFDRHRSRGVCKKPEDLGLELRGNIWAFPTDTDWNAQFGREVVVEAG